MYDILIYVLKAWTQKQEREWVLSTRFERWLKQPFFLFVFDAQKNRILKET